MTEQLTVLRADAMLTPAGVVVDAELAFVASGAASGRIVYSGSRRPDAELPAGADVRELGGHVLMPGLVNGHTHSAMTLLRGVSDDEGFMPWLAAVQGLEQHLTHDDITLGLQLAMLEMIETGTIAFADMYHWDTELVETVRAAGMRAFVAPAVIAPGVVPFPEASPWDGAEGIVQTEALAARYADDPQIRVAFGTHAPYTCPPEVLSDVRARALALGIPIQIHVSESLAEIEQITERYGNTPGDHLDALGLFDADVLAAHCVHLTPSEIELFARTRTAVSHNPVSNLKLGCGIADLPAWQRAGLRISLGTDGTASNNTLDLFEEIKLGTILHRGANHDAAIVRAADVIDIATRGGAEAIGFPDSGALEAGRLADVIALDITGSAATPLDLASMPGSLVSHIGFAATGADVRHVFIGGRHVYADGAHLTLDAADIRERAIAARKRIVAADAAAGAAAAGAADSAAPASA